MSEQRRFSNALVEADTAARSPAHRPRRRRTALPLETVCAGMLVQEVRVDPPDVVFVKGLIEASDGLAAVFAERGGELTIVAPEGRAAELAELLADLEADLRGFVTLPAAPTLGQKPQPQRLSSHAEGSRQ